MNLEERALRPPPGSADDDVPNANVPAPPPGTVGPPSNVPGDPDGVMLEASPPAPPNPPAFIHPSRWSGWPADWFPPVWGSDRLQQLTDIAWTSLDLNSSVFASMPPYLIGQSSTLPDEWMTNPSPGVYNSWADFASELMWNYQLGEAIVIATARYANGYPARFHVVPSWMVDIDFDSTMQRQYRIGQLIVPYEDVLHVRYQGSADDARGHGPLEVGRYRMIAAATLLRYATQFIQSGGVPSSVLEHPEELTPDQAAELREQWVIARMAGLGIPAVMSGGVTWKATQTDPLSSALTELASYYEARIAVLLGVPPFLVGLPTPGNSMTYSTTESIYDFHWRSGLKPKAQKLMMALSGWLLPRGTNIEVNRDEYVRPGPLERAQTQQIYVAMGALTVDEVRAMERFDTGAPVELGVFK